jgi:hypothetical protein
MILTEICTKSEHKFRQLWENSTWIKCGCNLHKDMAFLQIGEKWDRLFLFVIDNKKKVFSIDFDFVYCELESEFKISEEEVKSIAQNFIETYVKEYIGFEISIVMGLYKFEGYEEKNCNFIPMSKKN